MLSYLLDCRYSCIPVLFLCLSFAKSLKKTPSVVTEVVLDRPRTAATVSTISNGVINVCFDDLEMIDSSSVASVATHREDGDRDRDRISQSEGEYVAEEVFVEAPKAECKLRRNVSFKDDIPSIHVVKVEESDDVSQSQKDKLELPHIHGPSLFQCSHNCFQ